jgi:hypothetical protein
VHKWFVSIAWHSRGTMSRTSTLKERRMTWTILADTPAQAISFVRDWVLSRPIPSGRTRRIVFTGASRLTEGSKDG